MRQGLYWVLVALLLAVGGCTGQIEGEGIEEGPEPAPESEPPLLEPENVDPGTSVPVDPSLRGTGELVPITPRARQRMDVDQLDTTIRQVTGGIEWSVNSRNQFEVLASTLGKPDFIESTAEDVAPSLLFQRFLGEAAREVCTTLAEAERNGERPEAVLMVEASQTDTSETAPEAINANIKRLLLRFHGQWLEPGSPDFTPWQTLFDGSVAATGDPVLAWRTVCVGLISHPDFYTY